MGLWRCLMIVPLVAGCGDRDAGPVPAGELRMLPPGTHQEKAEVPGLGEVFYTIDVPEGYDGSTPVPLALVLHFGYQGDRPAPHTGRRIIEAFRPGLADLGGITVAPDALGGNWTTEENEKLAIWLTESAVRTYAIDSKRILITGFSLGGQGTWHIGSRHQDLFTGAIPVSGRVAGSDAEWSIPVYAIHSDADTVVPYDAAKRHTEGLKARGATVEFKSIHALDHYNTAAYAPYVGDGVRWLLAEWQ